MLFIKAAVLTSSAAAGSAGRVIYRGSIATQVIFRQMI